MPVISTTPETEAGKSQVKARLDKVVKHYFKITFEKGWRCCLVEDLSPSMDKALGSFPHTEGEKNILLIQKTCIEYIVHTENVLHPGQEQ